MAAEERGISEELRVEERLQTSWFSIKRKECHSDNCSLWPPSRWVQKEAQKGEVQWSQVKLAEIL